MPIRVASERKGIQEAAQVLMMHMSPAKATRFRASWQVGEGDYLFIREQIFAKENVKPLYQQIGGFQKKNSKT